MRALGIDPGLAFIGWGIVKTREDGGMEYGASGTIKTKPKYSQADRLMQIWMALEVAGIKQDEVRIAAIENIVVGKNGKTSIQSAEAAGVCKLWLKHRKFEVAEFQPSAIKKELTGNGNATKVAMAACVNAALSDGKTYGVPDTTNHETDALAAAIMLLRLKETY